MSSGEIKASEEANALSFFFWETTDEVVKDLDVSMPLKVSANI